VVGMNAPLPVVDRHPSAKTLTLLLTQGGEVRPLKQPRILGICKTVLPNWNSCRYYRAGI